MKEEQGDVSGTRVEHWSFETTERRQRIENAAEPDCPGRVDPALPVKSSRDPGIVLYRRVCYGAPCAHFSTVGPHVPSAFELLFAVPAELQTRCVTGVSGTKSINQKSSVFLSSAVAYSLVGARLAREVGRAEAWPGHVLFSNMDTSHVCGAVEEHRWGCLLNKWPFVALPLLIRTGKTRVINDHLEQMQYCLRCQSAICTSHHDNSMNNNNRRL